MVVYAEFEIPAEDLRIGRALGGFPDVAVEMDRIVPTGDAVVPFIWVDGVEPSDVIRAVSAEDAVEHIRVLNREEDGTTLFRVVWNRQFRDTVVELGESDVALLSGVGTADLWRFEIRAPNKEPLSDFREILREMGVTSTVVRLHETPPDRDHTRGRLTESQLEALELAYERGYFDNTRKVSLGPLATELGISRQAFSGRLRRGIHNILSESFGETKQ